MARLHPARGAGVLDEVGKAGPMFATNLLGRFLLTDQLLPLLDRGAPTRVLVVTGPSPDRLDFDDLMARIDFKPFAQFRGSDRGSRAKGSRCGAPSPASTCALDPFVHMDQMGEVDYAPGGLITDDDTQWRGLETFITFPPGNDSRDQTRWTSHDLLPAFSSPPWGRSALRVPERASGLGDNEVLAGDADLRHDLLDARDVRAWVSGYHRDEAT